MNWLITGGCGFIGLNLISYLQKQPGIGSIRVLDNLKVGKAENLPPGVELIRGDIVDFSTVLKAAEDVDAIVHLAANTGVQPSLAEPVLDFESNALGTLNVLEACRKLAIHKFVFASSGAVLGEGKPPFHEELLTRPISPYGASKLAGETYCHAYSRSYGLNAVSLRFSNVYGPWADHKESVVAKFIKSALGGEPISIRGDGSQTRDFLFVGDLVESIYLAAQSSLRGEVLQISTAKETTIENLAQLIANECQAQTGEKPLVTHIPALKGEVGRNYASNEKAHELLGWKPRVELGDGIHRTIQWFLAKTSPWAGKESTAPELML